MDDAARQFLAKNLIPPHVCSLLGVYGVSFIHDLYEFGEEDIKEIEASVREGTIGGQTDLNDASNLLKFLDSLHADYTKWSFRPIDKKKLLRLSALAKKILEEEIEQELAVAEIKQAEALSKTSARKKESDVIGEYLWIGNDGAVKVERSSPEPDLFYTNSSFGDSSSIAMTEPINSPIERKRIRKTYDPSLAEAKGESKIASMMKMYNARAFAAVNEILNRRSTEKIDKTHVKVTYDSTKSSFKVSVQCVICGKQVALSRTSYSVSGNNYEIHLSRNHKASSRKSVGTS